jgi:hypothetical protein
MWKHWEALSRKLKLWSLHDAVKRAIERQQKQKAELLLGVLQANLKRRHRELARIRSSTLVMRNVKEALQISLALGDSPVVIALRGKLRVALMAAVDVSQNSPEVD